MHIALTDAVIDSKGVVNALKAGEDGAVTVFDGIVRNNTKGRRTLYLEYSAYETMALEQRRLNGLGCAMWRWCTGWGG